MVQKSEPSNFSNPSNLAQWQEALLLKVKQRIASSWDIPSCIFAIVEENNQPKALVIELEDLNFKELIQVWRSFINSKKPVVAMLASLKSPNHSGTELFYEVYHSEFKKSGVIEFSYYPEFKFKKEKPLNPQF